MLPIGVGTRDSKRKSLGLFFVITSVEFLDSSRRIYHSLRTCEEWVTLITDVNFKCVLWRFVYKRVSTCTCYCTVYESWVKVFFHLFCLLHRVLCTQCYIFFKSVWGQILECELYQSNS